MFKNYLKITWKVLQRKKVYTFVTLAGIIIPVTFIVLITSFLVQLNSYDAPRTNFRNVMFVDNVTWKAINEKGETRGSQTNPPTLHFINKYVKTLKSPKAVSAISNDIFGGKDIIYQNNKANEVLVKFTDHELWHIANFKFIKGRPFNKTEFDLASRLAVIDKKTAITFFGTTDAIGETLQIKSKTYKVVGVIENINITITRLAANIYLPYSCNDNYLSKSEYSNWSTAIILCKNKASFGMVEQEYQEKLKTVDFSDWGGANRVESRLDKESYIYRLESIASSFYHFRGNVKKSLYISLMALVFFFIVLPAFNLININLNRVYERFSEIGVRKSFGATKLKLIHQFLFESLLLIFAGGILSITISTLIVFVVNKTEIIPGIQLKIHFAAVLISLVAIFILGVLSSLVPSMRMAHTSIVHSLSSTESK